MRKILCLNAISKKGTDIFPEGYQVTDTCEDPDAILAMGYGEDHDFSDWKANIRGVDLNANFSHKWGIRDEIDSPRDAGWCGPEPMSEPESRAMQKLLDNIIRSMRQTLEAYHIAEIFEMQRGTMRIRPEAFTCDAYRFFLGDSDAVSAYRGEYMNAYSWASITESYMDFKSRR